MSALLLLLPSHLLTFPSAAQPSPLKLTFFKGSDDQVLRDSLDCWEKKISRLSKNFIKLEVQLESFYEQVSSLVRYQDTMQFGKDAARGELMSQDE